MSEPEHEHSEPPNFWWWVVNVYSPAHRELITAISGQQKLIYGLFGGVLTILGGVVAALVTVLATRGH